MALNALIGSTTTGTANDGADYSIWSKFTATFSGTIDRIKVYSRANGNMKVGLYADSAGTPGARLGYNDTGQACALNQWNTLTISATSIVAGTSYWLVYIFDTQGTGSHTGVNSGGTRKYKAATYSSWTFPDPAGLSGEDNDSYYVSICGCDSNQIMLLGWDNDTWDGGTGGKTNVMVDKWTALATYTVNKLRIKVSTDGNIKVAIYADNAGEPGALLSALNTDQAVVAGWNDVTLSTPVNVTNGTVYWIGFLGSVTAGMFYYKALAGRTNRFKAATYSSWSWPDPAGSGYSTQDDYDYSDRGWGAAVILVSLSGTLNLSGSLVTRLASKILTGTLNMSGTVRRKIKHSLAGTLNLSGVVSKKWKAFKSLVGSLSFTGLVSVLRKIIGAGAVSVDDYLSTNTFHLSKFAAEFTGDVSVLKVYLVGSYNIKVAVYSDSSGEPGSLLSVINTPTAIVTGWNTITIPSVSVNQGTPYWLAFNSG
jgi:hypothetical protein